MTLIMVVPNERLHTLELNKPIMSLQELLAEVMFCKAVEVFFQLAALQ